jgi:hypothetical protein
MLEQPRRCAARILSHGPILTPYAVN